MYRGSSPRKTEDRGLYEAHRESHPVEQNDNQNNAGRKGRMEVMMNAAQWTDAVEIRNSMMRHAQDRMYRRIPSKLSNLAEILVKGWS